MPGLRPQAEAGDDSAVPTLAELITAQKRESGLSYEDYAARTDFVVSRQRFQQLGTKADKEFPEPGTLTAIAKAIEVDVALVVLATAKSLGMDVQRGSDSELAMMLPAAARNLTRAQRNALLALIRSTNEPIHRLFIGNDWISAVSSRPYWKRIGLFVLVKRVFRQPVNISDYHGLRCGWSQVRVLPGAQVRPHIHTTPNRPNHRLFIGNELCYVDA